MQVPLDMGGIITMFADPEGRAETNPGISGRRNQAGFVAGLGGTSLRGFSAVAQVGIT